MLRKKEKLTMPENEQTENPQLVLQEVSKVYSNGKRALNQMSMVLTPGIYGLLGPNGHTRLTLHQNHKKIISMLRSASIRISLIIERQRYLFSSDDISL